GGTMIEWLSPQGGGGSTLATILAGRVLTSTSTLVVVDSTGEFYPPALTRLGVSLSQIVVIRPKHVGEALWAFEQSLRCSGVSITMVWVDHLTDQVFRRLQLATEAGGGIGFLIRPSRFEKQRSWADARFLVEPICEEKVAHKGDRALLQERSDKCFAQNNSDHLMNSRRLRIQLLHCRGRMEGGQIELEIYDETNNVHLASRLASPETQSRKTGA
ncbi:MAG: ImuA family protein, partial [Planctomycetaceae bacterium]